MNLLTPHLFLCFVCEETITLDAAGGMGDYKKHLTRHKNGADIGARLPASTLLARWTEIEACSEDLTDVPIGFTVRFKHDSMICLRTLESRKRDPCFNVLIAHGQRTLQFN